MKELKKITQTCNLKHLYRNELDKASFAHDAAYSDRKDLAKSTISAKIRKDRAYEIARNCGYDKYKRVLASVVCRFFDKKTALGINVNEQIAEELHKPVIKKFKKEKSMQDLNIIFGQQI